MAELAANKGRVCVSCQQIYIGPTRHGRCNACRQRHQYRADVVTSRQKANQRARYLKHKYGLTLDDYEAMLAEQGGRCAICGREELTHGRGRFHVDHDHACCAGTASCGECIRGLLCGYCNVGLAQFKDDPDALLNAAAYLGGGRDR